MTLSFFLCSTNICIYSSDRFEGVKIGVSSIKSEKKYFGFYLVLGFSTGQVGPQDPEMGPIRSTSKRVQHYNVLNKPDLDPTRFWVGPSGSNGLSQVWPKGQNLGLVGLFWPH